MGGGRTLPKSLPKTTRGLMLRRRGSKGARRAPEAMRSAAEAGVAGPGRELPHLDRIQRSFGRHDVSGVAAHTGGAAADAAASIGAEAYAVGGDVAFRGSPDLHTAAHEAAHVVQQRAGVQLKGGVGRDGDAYERHADRVADAVVAGTSAERILDEHAGAGGRSGLQRRGRRGQNPQDTELSGQETTHAPLNTPDDNYDAAGIDIGEKIVRVIHGEDSPLELNGTPDPSSLYEEAPEGAVSEPGGPQWEIVYGIHGSVQAPIVRMRADETSVYVEGGPDVQDVIQGFIGSCYILAAITEIAARDPGHITDMVSVSGENVTFRFHRLENDSWVEAPVTVDRTLLSFVDDDGELGARASSSFRVNPDPARTEWFGRVQSATLDIVRTDYLEVALWAPLMEKAYARYAEQYGQYGGDASQDANARLDDDGNVRSGYEIIEGGYSDLSYGVLYGPDVVDAGAESIEYDRDDDLVDVNLAAIEQILRGEGEDMADDERMMLTASAGSTTPVRRLGALVDEIIADRHTERYPSLLRELRYVRALIRAWEAADADDKDARAERISRAADDMRQPGAWPILHSDAAKQHFRDLNELLNIVAELGDDASPGQRFTYAQHAYAILGASFRDADGNDLALTMDNLDAEAARIDVRRSIVTLRNPHGTNTPDERGRGESGEHGTFTLTLDQFFRAFDTLEFGHVRV